MKNIYIGREIGDNNKPFIIGEAGINHDGSLEKALELVDAAAECGVDVVKFQTHLPQYEMLKSAGTAVHLEKENLYELLARIQLSKEDHQRLQQRANDKGIMFMSTAYCREAIDFLDEFNLPAYKIGSGELTNIPLLKHIARKQKPMVLSTAASNYNDIDLAVDHIRNINDQLALMHCVFEYPADPKDCNINLIPLLKQKYNVPVGFSDHSQGINITLAALGLGANLIEKHFTIDRRWPGPDQKASLEPDELSELVRAAESIHYALGSNKQIFEGEKGAASLFRHSLVITRYIKSGETLSEDNLGIARPGSGIHPKEYDNYLGRVVRQDLEPGTQLKVEYIA